MTVAGTTINSYLSAAAPRLNHLSDQRRFSRSAFSNDPDKLARVDFQLRNIQAMPDFDIKKFNRSAFERIAELKPKAMPFRVRMKHPGIGTNRKQIARPQLPKGTRYTTNRDFTLA